MGETPPFPVIRFLEILIQFFDDTLYVSKINLAFEVIYQQLD